MAATVKRPPKAALSSAWKAIPPRMRVLYITSRARTGGWLAESFASEGGAEIELQEALGSAAGLARAPRRGLRRRAGQPRARRAGRDGSGARLPGGRGRRADHRPGDPQRAGDGGPVLRSRGRRLRLCQHDDHAKPGLDRRPGGPAAPTDAGEQPPERGRAAAAAARARRGGEAPRPAANADRQPGSRWPSAGVARRAGPRLPRIAPNLRDHGLGQSGGRAADAGRDAGHRGRLRSADDAIAPARAGGIAPRPGGAEHAARHDAGGPAGVGDHDLSGRGLSRPVPGAGAASSAADAARFPRGGEPEAF